jgi:hypothetical protein
MKARRIIAIDRDIKLLKRLQAEMIELGYGLTVFEFTSVEACYRALFPELATVQDVKAGQVARPGEKNKPAVPPVYRMILTRELTFVADKDLSINVPDKLWNHPIPGASAPEAWGKILADVDLENLKRMVILAVDTSKVQHLLVDVRLLDGKSDWVEFRIAPFQSKQALIEVHIPAQPKEITPSKDSAVTGPGATATASSVGSEENAGYDLIILDTDLVKDPVEWITKMRAVLAEKKLLVGASGLSTRFLLTGFENPKFDNRKYRTEWIQDYVFKPFDWPIICQKIGLALSEQQEPPNNMLFNMKVNKLIDLAKDVHIEEISEFGWVGWNPVPLKSGTCVSFFSPHTTLGRADESIVGQVYKCERHPARPELYRIWYSFIGLKNSQVAALRNQSRKFMQQQKQSRSPKGKTPSKPQNVVRTKEDDPLLRMMKKETPPGHGLVVDFDRETVELVKDAAKSVSVHGIEIKWFSSISPLLRMLNVAGAQKGKADVSGYGQTAAPEKDKSADLPVNPIPPAVPPEVAAPVAVSADEFDLTLALASEAPETEAIPLRLDRWGWTERPTLSLELGTGRLLDIDPTPAPEDLLFGKAITDSMGQTVHEGVWCHPADAEFFRDFVAQSFARKKAETCFRYLNAESKEFWIRVQSQPTEVGAVSATTWSFTDAKPEEAQDYLIRTGQAVSQGAATLVKYDFLILDAALLPEDPGPLIKSIRDALVSSGASRHGDQIPIIVLGEEGTLEKQDSILAGGASEVLHKPIDRTLLVSKLSLRLGLLDPKFVKQLPDMVPCDIDAFVAKKVKLATLSEFGVVIVISTKFRPGTFLRFFAPMLIDDKGFGVLGRCYKLEEVKDGKSTYYLAHFSFFALTDVFQKHIRKYIRESYADAKSEAMNE